MKKLTAIGLALAMLLMLCACGTDGQGAQEDAGQETGVVETEQAEQSDEGNAGEEAPTYHIGVILYGREDSLGSIVYSNLNYAADVLGVELTWMLGDYDPDAQIASAENLITSGVDGILCLPLGETATQKISALCEEAGVYFAICFRTVSDEAILAEVTGREMYLGNSTGADEENAKELVRIMAEAGKTNCAFYYASPSTSMALRNDGFREGMEEYGVTQLAEATIPTDGNLTTMGSTVQNFVTTNQNLDAIILAASSSGIGETVVSTLSQMNVQGKVSFACFDVFEGIEEAFEQGYLSAACGGQTPQATIMFMMLYNAIDGHRLAEGSVEMLQKFIFLTSVGDCAAYTEYVANPDYQIFDEEDIRNMTVRYNPDCSMELLEQFMDEYSLETVLADAQERG